jgi:hypothetical protein
LIPGSRKSKYSENSLFNLVLSPQKFPILWIFELHSSSRSFARTNPLLLILALAVASTQAEAQSWPTRPIRAIVPYTAGSDTDVTARVILNQLSSELGQSIVVENRVGAGGTIGTAAAAKAEPDGYTILVQSSALTIAPSSHRAQNVRVNPETGNHSFGHIVILSIRGVRSAPATARRAPVQSERRRMAI